MKERIKIVAAFVIGAYVTVSALFLFSIRPGQPPPEPWEDWTFADHHEALSEFVCLHCGRWKNAAYPELEQEQFYTEVTHPCFTGYAEGFEHAEPDAAGVCPRCGWRIAQEETPPQWFNVPLDDDIQGFVINITEGNEHITPPLVFALMERESGYRADAISATNDYGLMQINGSNHAWLARQLDIEDFLDPFDNIRAGVHVLQVYVDRGVTDTHKLLMCYRHNHGGAAAMWEHGVYETDYTRDVVGIMQRIQQETED